MPLVELIASSSISQPSGIWYDTELPAVCDCLSPHQVRRKLHLKALAFTRADSSSGLRLPGSYEALPSAEDDDDLAAVALAGVEGARDGTAEELARIRAAAQQPEGGRDAAGEQQGGGHAGGQIVDHLPPANGAEDVYTLLKMYTVSSELVSHG